MLPEYSNWNCLSVEAIVELFQKVDWILRGGYALEAFHGKAYRSHSDIDILIKRSRQNVLLQNFDSQRIYVADQGQLSPLDTSKYYSKPIQDIWILTEDRKAWALQIMLIDVENGNWVYKRNELVQLPFKAIYFEKEGVKILKPEIQLLYKSKVIRQKDQLDFETINNGLNKDAKRWLEEALIKCGQPKHPWIELMKNETN